MTDYCINYHLHTCLKFDKFLKQKVIARFGFHAKMFLVHIVILDRFGNHFTLGWYEEEKETRESLINISTGVVATYEVGSDLLNAKSKGKEMMF